VIRSLALVLLCSCIPQKSAEPEHHYHRPTGNTPLVMTNETRYPICNIEMSLESSDPDMLPLGPLDQPSGEGPSKQLAPGKSLELRLMNGKYTVRMFTCNQVLYGGHDVVIDGPLALGLGGPDTTSPATYRHSMFEMHVPGEAPSHSSGASCKPAGDTSALDGGECCSGSVTAHSAKHPGPSHCSYPDEL